MKRCFIPNLSRRGRWARGVSAIVLLVLAGFTFRGLPWLALLLALGGAFTLFEALRGWCVLRAYGLKTRL